MQKEDRLPRDRFGYVFLVLARRWRRRLEERLAEAGFTEATWRPLIHLAEIGDGVTQKTLAFALGLDTSSLVRLIDILVARGLVERRIDPQDRRARLIHLTEDGRSVVERLRAILSAAEEPLLADLDDHQIESMLGVLGEIDRRLLALEADEPAPA